MNRGGVGARSLNIELQAALNPAGERKVQRFGWTFAPGDKVMQIENDYDKEVYNGERAVAERLLTLANGTLPWPWIDPDKALPWVEQRTGLTLADSQQAAVRLALLAKVLVITGGPGVGKTTIVNSILRILAAKGVRLLRRFPLAVGFCISQSRSFDHRRRPETLRTAMATAFMVEQGYLKLRLRCPRRARRTAVCH